MILKAIVVNILTFEAKLLVRRKRPTIIAITGSVGKTSTKDAIYAVLRRHCAARKSQKSFNSEIGVPLTVLGLSSAWSSPLLWVKNLAEGMLTALFAREYPKVLVLETGVDRPGDMGVLAGWLKPHIVVLTRLPDVPAHIEYFATPEAVIAEKMELVQALRPDGVLIYNNDDEQIRREIEHVRQASFGYSRYSPSHYTVSGDTILYDGSTPHGMEFTLTHFDESAPVTVSHSLGVQHAYNFAAATAVGAQFDIDLESAATALSEHRPPAGRMRLITGVTGTLIIDDTYNSSPVAAERALLTLKEIKHTKRKIAVLGDMLELGQYSVPEHERIGALVPECADMLITIGVRARKFAEGALEHGMSEKVILQYDDVDRAAQELRTLVKTGDVILVKASQSIRAEKVVQHLMDRPELAPELLVRQDPEWIKR